MNSEEKAIIIQEAEERLRSLKEYSTRRREWYQDIHIRIADKQSEHLISISSISAAIIALTVALQIQKNFWIELSFWSLIVTVILGALLALLLIFHNKKAADYTRKIELSTIDSLKKSTNEVIQNPEIYEKHKEDFSQEAKKLEESPDKYRKERKILEGLYSLVLILFASGMLGLIGAWVTKSNIALKTAPISSTTLEYANIEAKGYMNNIVILVVIALVSVALGLIKYGSLSDAYKGKSWQLKFIELWNGFVSFFIAGLIGYYFILVRWPMLSIGADLTISDFGLLIFFMVSAFGHLPILSKNITDGIEAIIKRVLEGK